jgi:hypothetical protein
MERQFHYVFARQGFFQILLSLVPSSEIIVLQSAYYKGKIKITLDLLYSHSKNFLTD